MEKGNKNHSVIKAFHLLEAFGSEKPEWGISELARAAHIHKSTVYRLLSTLLDVGVVVQNPDNDRYSLGMKLFELGHRMPLKTLISQTLHPTLRNIAREIDETVQFLLPAHDHALVIDQVISPFGLKLSSTIPSRLPYLQTAGGRALLFKRPDKQSLISRLSAEEKAAYYLSVLEAGEALGYYLEKEEYEAGLVSLALPVCNATGDTMAAVSVAGPASRFKEHMLTEYVSIVSKSVKQLEETFASLKIPSLNPYLGHD